MSRGQDPVGGSTRALIGCALFMFLQQGVCWSQCSVDSLSLETTPLWLGTRVGLSACEIKKPAAGEQLVTMILVSETAAEQYLIEHDGQIDFGEAYPDGDNPYDMPVLILFASMASPLNITRTGLEPFIDPAVQRFLRGAGKLQGDELHADIRFYPARIERAGMSYAVTAWVPAALLAELGANERLTQ